MIGLLVIGLLTFMSAACSTEPQPQPPRPDDALAIVDGAHANAPSPQLPTPLNTDIDKVVRSQGFAAVVVNSGQPTITTQGSLSRDCNNPPSCDQAISDTESRVAATVKKARASKPEDNLLDALNLAALSLRDHTATKTLDVIDSGLQTTGSLHFQEPGTLDAAPADIANFLATTNALPNLHGMSVTYIGLGDTWAPQHPLPPAQRANLKAIWKEVAHRAGATEIHIMNTPLAAVPPSTNLPLVTPVPPSNDVTFTRCKNTEIPDTAVSFKPGTAELKDPPAAKAVLRSLAQSLTECNSPILLTGATADDGPFPGQLITSQQRADAVKTILIQFNVPSQLLSTNRVGSHWPGHIPDHATNGALLPGPAELNRKVIVTLQRKPSR